MKPSTERKLIRWLHIFVSLPLVGFVYGPLADNERAAMMLRWVFFPSVVLSGLWLWKGQVLKKKFKSKP